MLERYYIHSFWAPLLILDYWFFQHILKILTFLLHMFNSNSSPLIMCMLYSLAAPRLFTILISPECAAKTVKKISNTSTWSVLSFAKYVAYFLRRAFKKMAADSLLKSVYSLFQYFFLVGNIIFFQWNESSFYKIDIL